MRWHRITLDAAAQVILHLISTLQVIHELWCSANPLRPSAWAVCPTLSKWKPASCCHCLVATVKAYSTRLTDIEEVLNGLTNDLANEIKKPDGQVQRLLTVLSSQAADVEIYIRAPHIACTRRILYSRAVRADAVTRLSGFQVCAGFLIAA